MIGFATLGPLHYRPHTGRPDLERFGAFFLAGVCFAIGFAKSPYRTAVAMVFAAIMLEAAQVLAPGRDAHWHDAVVKSLGALSGLSATYAMRRALPPKPHPNDLPDVLSGD
ncbi:VanZ family protein [Caulobacter sp. S45]|uniref:VanZ family protein n=1 Tax=Caulobacter sp. S45 TaxID=1641861 RepID=UPI00131D15B3|nr:VanZ family protein [Caulobacter sp. S45]